MVQLSQCIPRVFQRNSNYKSSETPVLSWPYGKYIFRGVGWVGGDGVRVQKALIVTLSFLTSTIKFTCVTGSTFTIISLVSWFINAGATMETAIYFTKVNVMLTELAIVPSGTTAWEVIRSWRTSSSIQTLVRHTEVLSVAGTTMKHCKYTNITLKHLVILILWNWSFLYLPRTRKPWTIIIDKMSTDLQAWVTANDVLGMWIHIL